MYILALNCGSSSLKFQVFDTKTFQPVLTGNAERVTVDGSFIKYKKTGSASQTKNVQLDNHKIALTEIINILRENEIDLDMVKAIGHRVVHGGDKFQSSVEINDEVVKTIEELSVLAPLHNPANLTGIVAAREVMPAAKHVAVFDTAFHFTMPDYNYRYAVPNAWYRELGVRRYGFHGTSHLYVSKRAAKLLGKPADKCNIISMHIGSGASAAAIKHGISIDTSLGMTATAGMVMGTRCGDLDPAVPFYVMDRLGLPGHMVLNAMNKQSGILGITECYADRRDVEEHLGDNDNCRLAFEIESARAKKFIGSFIAAIEEPVDAIVFTAGVGENGYLMRAKICENLEHMGIKLDAEKNAAALAFRGVGEVEISAPDSKIRVFMIPTNEELVIVEDTLAILNGTYNPNHLEMKYSFI